MKGQPDYRVEKNVGKPERNRRINKEVVEIQARGEVSVAVAVSSRIQSVLKMGSVGFADGCREWECRKENNLV
jgi:hypothetical protein